MKKNKNKSFTRLNLYLDLELADKIKTSSERDYLKPTTWTTQFLRKNLLDNNDRASAIRGDYDDSKSTGTDISGDKNYKNNCTSDNTGSKNGKK